MLAARLVATIWLVKEARGKAQALGFTGCEAALDHSYGLLIRRDVVPMWSPSANKDRLLVEVVMLCHTLG